MIVIRNIENPFKPNEAEKKSIEYVRDLTLKEALNISGFEYENKRIIVSGKREHDLSTRIENDDEVTIIPDIKAPVVAIVSAIASFAVVHPFMFAYFVLSIGYSIYQYLNQPRMPDFGVATGGTGSLDEGSPTYGWDGAQTTQEVGIPIAVVYGEHKIGGNIINQFLWEDGEKNYLNVLIALCEGEIESIGQIYINDNPIENFDGIDVIKRYGTNDQPLMENFEDLHNIYPISANLTKDNPYIYTMMDSDVEAFEIQLRLNNGLYQQSSAGDLSSWSVTYRVEYKQHGSSSWIDLGEQTISEKSRTSVRRVFRKDGLSPNKYDIRVTRTSEDSSLSPMKVGDLVWFQLDEIKTDDLKYPHTALLALKLLATDQLSGSMPNITSIVKGKKVKAPLVMHGAEPINWEDYYWDGLKYRLLSNNVELSWDGTSYVEQYTANPVWCLVDLITNTRYGLGDFIQNINLDMVSLLEMSRYCDERVSDGDGGYEKRFRMDVVVDINTKALDLLVQLCATFNAMPVYSAGGISFKIDKEQQPTQLFGMGNMVKDSFAQSWKTLKEVPNVIEIQFMDKDKSYRQETISYIDESAMAQGVPIRKMQLRLFTTKTSYAIRAARYALKVAKYINRSINFKAGIDAVACQAGDVISISHDIPQWGFSGRVQEGSTKTFIRLDRLMTIENGRSYRIQVRFSDDTIEERAVLSPTGDHREIVCDSFSQVPQHYDVYAIGEINKVKKDFRVVSIQRDNTHEVQIQALEYNDYVYDDSDVIIPDNNFSMLSTSIPSVQNLRLTERLVKKPDGTIENSIDVWFDKPNVAEHYIKTYARAKIYLSDNGGSSWGARGETTGTHFQIIGDIADAVTYKIKVVSISDLNQEGPLNTSPTGEITIVGKSAPPSDVDTFLVNQDRDRLYFGWAEISDVDVWGYEIRWGADWDSGSVVTFQQGTHYLTTNFRTGIEQSYWIKAIDTSGNYSKNPKVAIITVTNIPFRNIIAEFEDHPLWLGVKNNLILDGVNLMIADGFMSGTYTAPVRDFGYLSTVYVGIDVVVSLYTGRRFSDDTTTRFNSSDSLRFSGTESPGLATFEIRTSEDNVVWTDWLQYQAGDYLCRYFQVRMTLIRLHIGDTINCSSLKTHGDLPDIDDGGHSTVIDAVQGKTIMFEKLFHEEPIVNVTITGGNGIYARFLAKSITGFTIQLFNGAGAIQTGTFDWLAHGI